jgi:hypothetical protein
MRMRPGLVLDAHKSSMKTDYSACLSSERKPGIYCKQEHSNEIGNKRLSIFSILIVEVSNEKAKGTLSISSALLASLMRSSMQYFPVFRLSIEVESLLNWNTGYLLHIWKLSDTIPTGRGRGRERR